MKIANVKGTIAKGMILGIAAIGLIAANPNKAEAQQFSIGVRVGQPYYAPRAYDYDRNDRADDRYDRASRYEQYQYARQIEYQRQLEFERRQARLRHEEWEREHRYEGSYGYR